MKSSFLSRAITRTIVFMAKIPVVGAAIKRGMVSARFDAIFQGWGERSWLFQSLQDAWIEIDSMTRQEAQRIHESLVENSPVVQKIRNLKIQFSVGPAGLKVIPESSDEGFNDARSERWEAWWARPELGSECSGAQLTRVWAGLLFDKGEVFIYKTQGEVIGPGGKATKQPMMQTIDAHRVRTPSGMSEDPKTKWPILDGKVINPNNGQCVAYFVKRAVYASNLAAASAMNSEEFDRLDAANVIHKFHILRPGQMRGLPPGMSAFNLVRDNMDLLKLEMQCAKLAAEVATVETNPAGELSTRTARQTGMTINSQNAAGVATTRQTYMDYNVTLAGKKIALKTGDTLKQFQIDRPSLAQQEYWDLHYTLICMGYNVPKLLVMPYNLQGTVTRADLDICTNAFRADFELLREICEDIYAWQGAWDLKQNSTFKGMNWKPANKEKAARAEHSKWVQDAKNPDDAHICLIRPPRSPNVDIGYTAKALEIELALGVKTPQDIQADMNKDWRVVTRQRAEYIDYINKLVKEFPGVEPGQISSLAVPQAIEDPTSRPDAPEGAAQEASPTTA